MIKITNRYIFYFILGCIIGFMITPITEFIGNLKGDGVVWFTFFAIIAFTVSYDHIKNMIISQKKREFVKRELNQINNIINYINSDFDDFKSEINNTTSVNKVKNLFLGFTEKNVYNGLTNSEIKELFSNSKNKELREILDLISYIRKYLPYKQRESFYKQINKHQKQKYDSRGIIYSDCFFRKDGQNNIHSLNNCSFCCDIQDRYLKSIDFSKERLIELSEKIYKFNG